MASASDDAFVPDASYVTITNALDALSASDLAKLLEGEIRRYFNKAKWISILALYENISEYGIIFGGAVRDYVQRVTAAKEYYDYCNGNKIDADRHYNNPEIHPASHTDRNLFPADIDVFITESKLKEFVTQAKKIHVLYKKEISRSHIRNYFFERNLEGALQLEKWECSLIMFSDIGAKTALLGKSVKTAETGIKIDFVVIKDAFLDEPEYKRYGGLYPPFGKPDFDVNLLMFKHDAEDGLQIYPMPYIKLYYDPGRYCKYVTRPLEKHHLANQLLDEIVANIKAKRARAVFPDHKQFRVSNGALKMPAIETHRLLKIKSKGYVFEPFETIFPTDFKPFWAPDDWDYVVPEGETSELCLICLDIFSAENRWFKCCGTCSGKIHQTCLTQFLRKIPEHEHANMQCPQCRSNISSKCPCGVLTFLNKIECANIELNDQRNTATCSTCQRHRSLKTLNCCECWSISCRKCYLPTIAEMAN